MVSGQILFPCPRIVTFIVRIRLRFMFEAEDIRIVVRILRVSTKSWCDGTSVLS